MAINLQKGQRISIGLSKVQVGLGWDPNQGTGQEYDLDASAFMLNVKRKIPNDNYFVFFNNKYSPDGSVEGADDDLTGGSSENGDDEVIKVDLNKVDESIQEIIFIVTIHESKERGQNFGQVNNSYIRVVDETKNEEIARYELEEDFSIETAIEFGRLYLKNGEWKFQAIGNGYNESLEYFVNKYS